MQATDKYKLFALLLIITLGTAQRVDAAEATDSEVVDVEPAPLLSHEDLSELAAPVALYPDDLLAIVLPASTYPLQVVAAARFRADESNDDAEPDPDWDESIVALLNYPEALALLNDDINWTWQLGQAVIEQEQALMAAIQDVRQQAYASGNIESDDKQTVYTKDQVVVIEPAEEDVIYVPYYDPVEVVVHQPRRVYHYYPRSYPVYYYPYRTYHHFYDDYVFWGLTSYFTVSWAHHRLSHYRHRHHHHRYYGKRYAKRHFYRTHDYRSPRHHDRRWSRRYTPDGHWRPAHRYAGHRQLFQQRHSVHRPLRDQRHSVHRGKPYRFDKPKHVQRRGRHEYGNFNHNRRAALLPNDRLRPDRQTRRQAERHALAENRRAARAENRDRVRNSVHRADNPARRSSAQRNDRGPEQRSGARNNRGDQRVNNRGDRRYDALGNKRARNHAGAPDMRTIRRSEPRVGREQRNAQRNARPQVERQRDALQPHQRRAMERKAQRTSRRDVAQGSRQMKLPKQSRREQVRPREQIRPRAQRNVREHRAAVRELNRPQRVQRAPARERRAAPSRQQRQAIGARSQQRAQPKRQAHRDMRRAARAETRAVGNARRSDGGRVRREMN